MKSIISFVIASAAVVSAQVTYNPADGTFTCAVADKAYCAGDSLGTDIIIRCTGTKGQPGRCTDNLAGQPPLGVQPALCYQSSPTAGDAACEKNCVVYGPTSSFTLPASVCTPYYTASTTSTSTTAASTTSSPTKPTTTTAATYTKPTTATECESTLTTSTGKPTYPPPPPHNSTLTFHPTGQTTTSAPPAATAGAAVNSAAGALAAIGLIAAYLL